jgi:hypothetical protein
VEKTPEQIHAISNVWRNQGRPYFGRLALGAKPLSLHFPERLHSISPTFCHLSLPSQRPEMPSYSSSTSDANAVLTAPASQEIALAFGLSQHPSPTLLALHIRENSNAGDAGHPILPSLRLAIRAQSPRCRYANAQGRLCAWQSLDKRAQTVSILL